MKRRSGFGWIEFISGLCMIVMGIFTVFRPQRVFVWAPAIYGTIAVTTGICDIVFYIKSEQYTGFAPIVSLIAGILSVMVGTILLAHPGVGGWILSILFPSWFIAHCISHLAHLNIIQMVAGKGYCYISLAINIIGLILGIMMFFEPVYTLVSLGILVGSYLIISGIESIVIAFSDVGFKL